MKIKFSLLFVLSLLLSVYFLSAATFAEETDISVTILPGNFYLTVFGDLQTGIELGGLGPPGLVAQIGYWNAERSVDYIKFFDSTAAPGFRLQFSLDSDFIYSGTSVTQTDLPASDFSVFAEWSATSDAGEIPTIGVDDLSNTYSIDSSRSCASVVPADYSFDSGFAVGEYAVSFSTSSFNYFTSTVSCLNEGTLNLGRLQLDMGFPEPGTYKASLFLVMVDG